jgi:hypothetical protein
MNNFLVVPDEGLLVALHGGLPGGQLQDHHTESKHVITLHNRRALPHEPIPDPLHLLRTDEALFSLKDPLIGSDAIFDEGFIDEFPCGALPTDLTKGHIPMMIIMSVKVDKSINNAVQEGADFWFGKRVLFQPHIRQQVIKAIIEHHQLPTILTADLPPLWS